MSSDRKSSPWIKFISPIWWCRIFRVIVDMKTGYWPRPIHDFLLFSPLSGLKIAFDGCPFFLLVKIERHSLDKRCVCKQKMRPSSHSPTAQFPIAAYQFWLILGTICTKKKTWYHVTGNCNQMAIVIISSHLSQQPVSQAITRLRRTDGIIYAKNKYRQHLSKRNSFAMERCAYVAIDWFFFRVCFVASKHRFYVR